jgi:phosphoserine aminotransferase
MQKRATLKSEMLYSVINESNGFYRCPVDDKYRSTMNVVFRLNDEELEAQFLKESAEKGMMGLKGHRSVGGCRASIYNSLPVEAVETLAEFMKSFAKSH